LISKIPFLKDKVPQFVADIISMFQPMVFQEGDFVCKEGTQADEMYFLIKGKAGIYYGQKLVVVIEEGSYFGEIGCIMGGIRRAGVKALSICELQALSRRNLNILLAEYPEVGEELKTVARDRVSAAKDEHKSDGGRSKTPDRKEGSVLG
jgi:CRP-like cAMP-binding protein